jgi:hypothetical protein
MKASPRHVYHGKPGQEQHGLHGQREPVEPQRRPQVGEKVLLIRNNGPDKRYLLTTVEKVTVREGDSCDGDETVLTLLHTNGLRESMFDFGFTWDEVNQRWFVWA